MYKICFKKIISEIMMNGYLRKVFIILIGLYTFSCSTERKGDSEIEELVFGVIVSADPDAQINRMDRLTTYLSERVGVPIKYTKGTSYAAVIEAMKTGHVHFALTGPFSYLIAAAKADAEPILATAYMNGKLNNYNSILITSINSGVLSMEDVKKNAYTLSIAFADPASTSGYLYPTAYLKSIGLPPDKKFKEMLFAGGHTAGVYSCLSGKVDLACTTWMTMERLQARDRINKNDYRILWKSDGIPPSPIYISKKVPQVYKDRLIEAYVNMGKNDPELMKMIKKRYRKDIKYVQVSDSAYMNLRKLVTDQLGELLEL